MSKCLLFGIVILTLFSCEKDSCEEEPLNQESDIMIYWWATASLNGPENNTIDWLIGEENNPHNTEFYYYAWSEDYSCEELEKFMILKEQNHPATENPGNYFEDNQGQPRLPSHILFGNDWPVQHYNDSLACNYPFTNDTWGTIKKPVSWFEDNGFIVYPTILTKS